MSRHGLRTGDWIGFNCGDHVTEIDGRHIGRVDAVVSGGSSITVRWLDTGWISYFNRAELIVVNTYDQRQRLAATDGVSRAVPGCKPPAISQMAALNSTYSKGTKMTDNRQKQFAKIKALLAKTTDHGCTEAEAMAALDKARELMDAYDISDSDLAFDGEKVEPTDVSRGPDDIRWALCGGVAAFCDCKVWGSNNQNIITFLGLQSDVMFATWLLDTLEKFVRRHSLGFLADMGRAVGGETDLFGAPLDGRARDHKRKSFVYGCTSRVSVRLYNATNERRVKCRVNDTGNGRSLVPVKDALVDDAFRKLGIHLRAKRTRGMNADASAYGRGQATGDRANFGRPVRGNSNGGTLAISRS